jgi:hypothetical protein
MATKRRRSRCRFLSKRYIGRRESCRAFSGGATIDNGSSLHEHGCRLKDRIGIVPTPVTRPFKLLERFARITVYVSFVLVVDLSWPRGWPS